MEEDADLFRAFSKPTTTAEGPSSQATPPLGDDDLRAVFEKGSTRVEPSAASTAVAPFVGFNRALINVAGAPVDLVNAALSRTFGYEAPEAPFGGSESIKRGLKSAGVDVDRFAPQSRTEEILQAGGKGVGEAASLALAAPAAVARLTAANAPRTAEAVSTLFGMRAPVGASRAAAAAPAAELAVPAFTGGAGAELAEGVAPEQYKGLAGLGGGLTGGAIGAVGVGAAKGLPSVAEAAGGYFAPMREGNIQRLADERLGKLVGSRAGTIDVVENAPRELVPGSRPTLFELTGDQATGQAQRRAETLQPAAFLGRRGEQAAARSAALGELTPTAPAEGLSAFLKKRLEQFDETSDQAMGVAREAAQARVQALGGEGVPEQYGEALRTSLEAAKKAMRAERSALYNAIDPEGTVNIVVRPIRESANEILEGISPYSAPLSGTAPRLFEQAQSLPNVLPFRDLTAFDSAISDAMKTEMRSAGETATWRQLVRLKSAVSDAIAKGVENQSEFEQQAVAAGRMLPENTIMTRIRQYAEGPDSQPLLSPNMTEREAILLEQAKTKHAEYAQTFQQGPVGNVLRTQGYSGQYRNPNATVVNTFFPAGNRGFEAATAFRQAVGDDATARATMQDYIAYSLKRAAMKDDGTIDPKKFAAWRQRHDSALRAFPELNGQFDDALRASQLVDELALARREAVKEYQSGVVKRLMVLDVGEDVAATVGGLLNRADSVGQMRQLAALTAKDPDAQAALKRAVADYMTKRFVTTSEAGTSDANIIKSAGFQKFVRDNRSALRTIFSDREVNSMQAIADDLHRSARSTSGNALPGRSTTAQDLLPDLSKGKETNLGLFERAAVSADVGQMSGGVKGILGGISAAIGNNVLNNMRKAGLAKVEDALVEALLNPDLAAAMLKRISDKPNVGADVVLGQAIRRLPVIGFSGATPDGEPRVARASGGRTMDGIEQAANALVMAAESTKKALGRETEALLNQDDNSIAKALEVANQAI